MFPPTVHILILFSLDLCNTCVIVTSQLWSNTRVKCYLRTQCFQKQSFFKGVCGIYKRYQDFYRIHLRSSAILKHHLRLAPHCYYTEYTNMYMIYFWNLSVINTVAGTACLATHTFCYFWFIIWKMERMEEHILLECIWTNSLFYLSN